MAIAWALLCSPELLVLDEATSAPDLATEHEVLSVVRALRPDTMVVLVTHRVSSLEPSDHVVSVETRG